MRYTIEAYKGLNETIHGIRYFDRFNVEIENVHEDALTAVLIELKEHGFIITVMRIES